MKTLTTFDPVNRPSGIPFFDTIIRNTIQGTGPLRSNVNRFVNLFQGENNGKSPADGVDDPTSPFSFTRFGTSEPRPGHGERPDEPGWQDVTAATAAPGSGAWNMLQPSFTGNAFDASAAADVVQIDVNRSGGEDPGVAGNEYAWKDRFYYTNNFYLDGTGQTYGPSAFNDNGGVYGRHANHTLIVPYAYEWLFAEMTGYEQDYHQYVVQR